MGNHFLDESIDLLLGVEFLFFGKVGSEGQEKDDEWENGEEPGVGHGGGEGEQIVPADFQPGSECETPGAGFANCGN